MTSPEVRHFTESFASYFTSVGFPKMAARVLMSLMISESGLTASEIAADLHISPAAVSGATRQLLQWSLIKRTPVRGSRRDRFEVVSDAWYRAVVSNYGTYKQLARMAGTGAQVLPKGSKGAERVVQMHDFFLFLNDRMGDLMHEWEQLRKV